MKKILATLSKGRDYSEVNLFAINQPHSETVSYLLPEHLMLLFRHVIL